MTGHMVPLVDGEIAQAKAPLPEDTKVLSRHIKQLGYFLRADIVGICRLPQYAVYHHDLAGNPVELNHKYAILLVVDQDYDTMCGSAGDDWISGSQSFIGYSTSAFIACIMANYIRKLGYPARAHHVFNYQVLVVPLLLLAGIGEMCRAGIVLNPFLGTRFKAAVVTTDLPLEPDSPVDFGLQEFCRKCLKCATECHARAIPDGEKVMLNGYENWRFDADLCSKYRVNNQGGSSCGRCIKVCPWNKPEGWFHDLVRWMVKQAPFLDGFMVKMDTVWGYGKRDERYKWWLDLEEVDGALKIPRKTN
jgi:reductive dehalogenase